MELTAFPADRRVALKTLDSALVDIEGAYALTPADGGKATLITYTAVQKDKMNIPAPVSVQRTVIKESFENLVAGTNDPSVRMHLLLPGAPAAG